MLIRQKEVPLQLEYALRRGLEKGLLVRVDAEIEKWAAVSKAAGKTTK